MKKKQQHLFEVLLYHKVPVYRLYVYTDTFILSITYMFFLQNDFIQYSVYIYSFKNIYLHVYYMCSLYLLYLQYQMKQYTQYLCIISVYL